ncbi:maltose alpha-D-glucosyltransferase [Aestuariimicrobium sp. p3-SID1156]|uniref:maltose alpha-D-glucosyltransferase n=1 Tax=Aestuariimicrobium sp. p3-SID1156 TaxID=2916038 RepID=UPI00223BE343|nr:maltose alpha-D-glucosyltransferase [Aestuariimicrobium sp. p3-SID1156]MCT1458115.1 maltose alpha-D-glucosyltransferase [Aestuariimicrobium sp. p3-SID1156]
MSTTANLPEDAEEHREELLDAAFESLSYPSRPARLRPRAKRRQASELIKPPFDADGRNPAYVQWLKEQSMLGDARIVARQLSGQSLMWGNPFAKPDPRAAVEMASVWFTAYPLSTITARGESFLGFLASEELWTAFERVGIDAVHTGPVKLAGGIEGWEPTPSVDGHFDRISMSIDPLFGTEEEFRTVCHVAGEHHGTIIDDIVPGHTGKGADFRLAEMAVDDYPGIYHMIDIPQEHWNLLPDVPEGADSVNLTVDTEKKLADEGLIIGALQRVIFFEPGVKETNWSATRVVHDVNGTPHRWVYLHYFKEGQPSVNWLDPTFAGMRLVMGDALHSLLDLGSGGLRLDANGFLGVEKNVAELPAWSEGHPLSQAANQLIGSMVRKVGGFTFQEMNLAVDDIVETSKVGPDLSYDFITRPAYQLALAIGDTEFLRLMLREGLLLGVDQASLVHALQNHDELTYELVHLETRHRDDVYSYGGKDWRGQELAEHIRQTLRDAITGEAGPYNAVFTQNGIACTTASVITASLGITDLSEISSEDKERIVRAHLLLAMYNAWQPGVFALSGWDLVGALPVDRSTVKSLIAQGDTRWLERGAYDLVESTDALRSSSGLPRADVVYGSLSEQLKDPNSFAMRLAKVLQLRKRHHIATGELLDVPEVSRKSMLTMVNRLVDGQIQVTVLNFSEEPVSGRIQSEFLPAGRVFDLATRRKVGEVDDLGGFDVQVPGFGGMLLVVRP